MTYLPPEFRYEINDHFQQYAMLVPDKILWCREAKKLKEFSRSRQSVSIFGTFTLQVQCKRCQGSDVCVEGDDIPDSVAKNKLKL